MRGKEGNPDREMRIGCAIVGIAIAVLIGFKIYDIANPRERSKETYVWICTGPMSKRYHRDGECKGLSSCSGNVTYIPLSDAKKMGRTECGYCYGD